MSRNGFFALMRGSYRIGNLLYLDAAFGPAGIEIRRLHHTFTRKVAATYADFGFSRIDPVLKSIRNGAIRPVDWSQARHLMPQGDPLFKAAAHLGLSTDGVTLPLAAPGGRIALLALQADLPADAWPAYRRCHLRDFQLLANLFHAALIEKDDDAHAPRHDCPLTTRETEVLAWAAAGKSYWEIAMILGIAERTVRFFMTNARRKLNVVSNAQAVAQAVRRDLIPTF